MNLLVQPSIGFIMPPVDTAVSIVRITVVPMATTLRPSRLAELTRSALCSVTKNCSESILCFDRSSTSTVRKLPKPACRVMKAESMPLISMRLSRCFEKCMPAVGAATAPSCAANMVW